MILVIARWTVKIEYLSEVGDSLRELQHQTRLEVGNLAYDIYRGENASQDILIYERYQDHAALEAHRQSQHFKSIVVGELLAKLENRQVDVCEVT